MRTNHGPAILFMAVASFAACHDWGGLFADEGTTSSSTASGAGGPGGAPGAGGAPGTGGAPGAGGAPATSDGHVLWLDTFGGVPSVATEGAVAFGPDGDVLFGGGYAGGPLAMGSEVLNATGSAYQRGFVATAAGSDGALQGAFEVGAFGTTSIRGVSVAPNGDVFVGGAYAYEYGMTGLASVGPSEPFDASNAMLLELSPSMNLIGFRCSESTDDERGTERFLAVAQVGARVVGCGDSSGSAHFAPYEVARTDDRQAIVAAYPMTLVDGTAPADTDLFVELGTEGDDWCRSVAGGPDGDLFITGSFARTLSTLVNTNGATDAFVARLTPTGEVTATVALRSTIDAEGISVATGAGLVAASFVFRGGLDVTGLGPVQQLGTSRESLILVMSTDLDPRAMLRLAADDGEVEVAGAVMGGDGHVFVAGRIRGSTTLQTVTGPTALTSDELGDAFVLKMTAQGAVLWARTFEGLGEERVFAVAADDAGRGALLGSFDAPVVFSPEMDSGPPIGTADFFLALLAP